MARNEKCFSITWRIENYNFSHSIIESPSFLIDSMSDTSWNFVVVPKSPLRKDHIAIHAKRNKSQPFGINVVTSLFTDDSSSPLYEGFFGTNPDMVFSSSCYVPHSQVHVRKRGEFIPPETLTIRCCMYKTNGSFSEAGQCYARTRIRVQRTAYIGLLKNFNDMHLFSRSALTIKSSSTDDELFFVEVFLGGDLCCKEKIWIEIMAWKENYVRYCKCKLFLLDSNGAKTECARNEKTFNETESELWEFPLYFTKSYLVRRNTQFLSRNTLTLKCEFAFSTGVEYQEIEDSEFGNLAIVNKNQSKFPSALEDLTRLYQEGILCDIKLRVETETFNAHKSILSARSSVFESMFATDMKEKISDCVTIEDLDANTVHRMLLYLYSDRLEDLDWEQARSLYFAADKYNIMGLKHKCSDFLKSNLQPPNCCDLLVLADMHQDGDLKKSVQEFIENYSEEIFRSDQWANFEKINPKLSIETFHAVYLGNVKN